LGNLLPSDRRDTEQERATVLKGLWAKMAQMEEVEEAYEVIHEEWIKAYQNSTFHEALTEAQKKDADFTISCFLDYTYRYFQIAPKEWDTNYISEICLDIIPRKVSSDGDFFENFGDILTSFLQFFQEYKGIATEELWKYVQEIKEEIPKRASDPRNWGMAKSFMMQAEEEGYDPSDQDSLNEFMHSYNSRLLSQPTADDLFQLPSPVRNPYKDIGRNQKVSVKYIDGRIVEDIKFKKVKKDLENGECELF